MFADTDPARRRALFPILAEHIHLAHCAVAPLCGPAAAALHDYANACSAGDQGDAERFRQAMATRGLAARLLGVEAQGIALLGPTTYGLGLIANGLDWRPGDEVVCCGDDYPANVYPWLLLEQRGVVVRRIRPRPLGCITWESVAAALGQRTRLVALPSCHYLSGYRPDIGGIGARLRAEGILFCVDAIQTLGAFPFPGTMVDCAAADAHKWLLGPSGAGITYVRPELCERIRPVAVGVGSAVAPELRACERVELLPGARRFEGGTPNVPGILAMRAAIELLLDAGIDRIAERILLLRARLERGLCDAGWQPMLADPPTDGPEHEWRSGILACRHPVHDPQTVVTRLRAQGIIASARSDHSDTAWLRLAPHAYLAEAEIDRVLAVLAG